MECNIEEINYDPYLLVQRKKFKKIQMVAVGDATELEKEGGHVSCPGERTTFTRKKSVSDGEVQVDAAVCAKVCKLAKEKNEIN